MNNNELNATVEEFPPQAVEFLQAFYRAKNVAIGTARKKIETLRDSYGLRGAIVTADEGVSDDDEELRVLEFYVLTKRGII